MHQRKAERIKLGHWCWTVHNGPARDILLPALQTSEIHSRAGAHVIKDNPVRSVYTLLDLPDMIIKQYRVRGIGNPIKYVFKRSKAAAESRGEQLCRDAMIPVPEVLAWGDNRRFRVLRQACLIERRIGDAVGLGHYIRDHLATAPPAQRAQPMSDVGALLAQVHNAGLSHPDFHPGNILVRRNDSGSAELFLIDLDAIRPLRLFRTRRRARDLAKLYHSLSLATDAAALDAVLAGYNAAAAGPAIPQRRIARLAQRMETTRLRSRTKRCLKQGSAFTSEQVDGLTVRKRRDWPTDEILVALRAHEEAKRLRDARLVKQSRNGWVTVVQAADARYAPRLVVKEPRFVFPIRVRRAWLVAHAFTVRGLRVPQHLALVERRKFGITRAGWLIARHQVPAQDLDRFLESHPNVPQEFFTRLAETISRLFDYGIYHGDLSGKNLLIQEVGEDRWRFSFLDLESVILWRTPTRRRRRKNVGQLYRSIRRWCDAQQEARFRKEMARLTGVVAIPQV
jgi:tRNA A-37 threonylcarbamoyl transferase component Bud32